jgi:hypothetical protein
MEMKQIKERFQNWLPLPQVFECLDSPEVSEEDMFPKGEVVEYYEKQGIGTISAVSGKKFPFSLDVTELIGPKGQAKYLRAGGRVGYDVARSGNSCRVVRMKVY